jgi:hypothetical protein
MADWVTISSLATAGGTLVLAVSTFASVRSANRAARAAERSLLAGLRPLLMPSRLEDPQQKIGFVDGVWLVAPGGGGAAQATDEAVYMGFGVWNAGSGIAVLHGWYFNFAASLGTDATHAPLENFHSLTRDLYIPSRDIGFWQGAFRDPTSADFSAATAAIEARERMVIDVLYGDHEGGQRVVTRFLMTPRQDDGWLVGVGRHWNIDRPDPR